MAVNRYVALLRGINVGGHRVKMGVLKGLFERLGYQGVETFIASGNVIFDCEVRDVAKVERQIEDSLVETLGYEVPTVVRSVGELDRVAGHRGDVLFAGEVFREGVDTLSVMFMKGGVVRGLEKKIRGFETEMDMFRVRGGEVYWLCRGKTMESLVDWKAMGKAVSLPVLTVRNMTTVRRMAARYC